MRIRPATLALLAVLSCFSAISDPGVLFGEEPSARVVLLGTGTPIADPERSGPSVAIVVEETLRSGIEMQGSSGFVSDVAQVAQGRRIVGLFDVRV